MFCTGCGTELSAPVLDEPPIPGAPRIPDVKLATIICLLTVAGQVVGAMLAFFVADAFAPRNVTLASVMPFAALATMLGASGALFWAVKAFKIEVKDRSPSGPAWVRGPWEAITKGVGIGMLIAMANHILLHFFGRGPSYLSQFTRVALTSGFSRIAWVIAAVVLAPVVAELAYRGILFGGFCRSVGEIRAAIGTTAIFLILNAVTLAHQPLAIFGITGMALAALLLRLRHNAIGPAVAVNFGYSALVTLGALLGN